MKNLGLGLIASIASARNIWVDSADRVIREEQGRQIVFHGVNVVYKVAPYIPESDKYDSQSSLTDKDIDQLVDWGFNLVRLGVMWEAVETAPGVYNQTYFRMLQMIWVVKVIEISRDGQTDLE